MRLQRVLSCVDTASLALFLALVVGAEDVTVLAWTEVCDDGGWDDGGWDDGGWDGGGWECAGCNSVGWDGAFLFLLEAGLYLGGLPAADALLVLSVGWTIFLFFWNGTNLMVSEHTHWILAEYYYSNTQTVIIIPCFLLLGFPCLLQFYHRMFWHCDPTSYI